MEALATNRVYVNVHTMDVRAGEIRNEPDLILGVLRDSDRPEAHNALTKQAAGLLPLEDN